MREGESVWGLVSPVSWGTCAGESGGLGPKAARVGDFVLFSLLRLPCELLCFFFLKTCTPGVLYCMCFYGAFSSASVLRVLGQKYF